MIMEEALIGFIQKVLPDATVGVTDRTGTMDHFMIRVVSAGFKEKGLLERHRLIYGALEEPMKDGRIHAVEIKALTPDEAKS